MLTKENASYIYIILQKDWSFYQPKKKKKKVGQIVIGIPCKL